MAPGQKLIPLQGMQLDAANQYMTPLQARYIKNLVYELSDMGEAGTPTGAQAGVMKPLESNSVYCILNLPTGSNYVNGTLSSRETNELYVWVWNSNNNHSIFRINGLSQTADILYVGDLQLVNKPQYFIAEGGCYLEVINVVDPDTGTPLTKKDLYWTNGFGYQGYLRTQDSLDTHYFDPLLFPYFVGVYDPKNYTRMGIPSPTDCITVTEIPVTDADAGLDNNRLFNTWQFRLRRVDVWGRPSEWGEINELNIPGINDCLSSSSNIPRCVTLSFDAGDPSVNTIEIAWRNCNDQQWYLENTLFLYVGSNLGAWWLRQRNPDIVYDPVKNIISYKFCRDKECDPITTTETDRITNPQPKGSQGLYKQNKNIALINNEDGFNPFSVDLKKKFSFNIEQPSSTGLDTRTITIYAAIWNQTGLLYTQVYQDGTNGFLFGDNHINPNVIREYGQYFQNKSQSGFGGYLVGSGYAISTQVYLDSTGNLIDDPTHNGMNLSPTHFTLQKWVFNNVPKGTYVFRLFSQLTDPFVTADYQDTSTTMWGLCNYNSNPQPFNIDVTGRLRTQELIIDVCGGDYNTLNDNQILVIADLATSQFAGGFKATSGYIYETKNNGFNEFPMELIDVEGSEGVNSHITDHNGFYWFETEGSGRRWDFFFYYKCVRHGFGANENGVGMSFINYWLDEVGIPTYPDYATLACNRVLIKGQALLSGTNIGISNSTVVLTRGRTAVTDNNGNFTIIAHDNGQNGIRQDEVIFTNGACIYTEVGGGCIAPVQIIINSCTVCQERDLILPNIYELVYPIERGLLSGGTYGIGVVQEDWLTPRKSYVEDLGYLQIPSIIQSQSIAPSKITAIIDPTARFDLDVQFLTFYITQETTIANYLSWIVDRVEFIDNTGNINLAAPTQIRIYYASVIEYNKQNNFSTTTAWQFIPQGANTPITGDKVLFYVNGDGKFFTKTIICLVRYDLAGTYFLIDYTSDLADLKQNALIRLVRQKTCTGTDTYFAIPCSKVKVVNGIAQQNTIVINPFDTYYLSRQIPVPTPLNNIPQTTTVTTTTTVGNTVTQVQSSSTSAVTANELRNFGFRFEHNSPSNFWGQGCWNIGSVQVKNPYESKLKHGTQVALSGALSITGQLSFLQYFDDALKFDFNINGSGNGIVYARHKYGLLLIITEYTNFIVGVDDNLARTDAQGNVQVPSAPNTFGKPERNAVGNYGCQLFDKNTIREREGKCMFLDSSRSAVVRHNFVKGEDVSSNGDNPQRTSTIVSWLVPAIKYHQQYNSANGDTWYFHGVINPANFAYLLSSFKVGGDYYVNEERGQDVTKQETIEFDLYAEVWKEFQSSVPEYWGYLEGATLGRLLFAFKKGIPYVYSAANNPAQPYNTFFGVVCERIYRFVFNTDGFKKKKFLWMEVYCPQSLYWSDLILTETNQQSRLLIANWKQGMYMWTAAFLCDMNTPFDPNLPVQTGINKLMDGNNLLGTWVEVRLIGDPAKNTVYSEFYGVCIDAFGFEKSGT